MTVAALETSTNQVLVAYAIFFALAYIASRWSYVVARRLPTWLNHDWKHQAETFLEKSDAVGEPNYSWWKPYGPAIEGTPKSLIRWLPLIGPLFTKEYKLFFNELWLFVLTWLLTMFCDPIDSLTGIVFFAMLRCAAMVDSETQLLPDCLTLPLMWFGLAKSLFYPNTTEMLAGAICGFMSLWLLQRAYYIIRKVDGMGGGDMKIAAAIGAWIGGSLIPGALFIGAMVGIVYAIVAAIKTKGFGRFAFGPSLAIGGILMYFPSHLLPIYTESLRAAGAY